jgi:ATP-dependent DNA helicase RecG
MMLQKGVFNGLSVGLLHGRMKPKDKQDIVDKFRNKEIQILVSTPVIEVGIDVPDAAVIVIESAERYGLASLHQLRGRVGRGSKEGFCFVSMSTNSRTSYERLKNLELIDNGLELAEIDMKMRGTGDIFGTMQHGYKKFRVASLDDVEFLEKAKKWAKNIYPRIDDYPLLKEKIDHVETDFIKNN